MGLFFALRELDLMQDFIALIDSGSEFLLARKAHGVVEVAYDASILEMQLGREIKLSRHAAGNASLCQMFPELLAHNRKRASTRQFAMGFCIKEKSPDSQEPPNERSEEPYRLLTVPAACHHGRTCTDR
jgi:hypothetical protein